MKKISKSYQFLWVLLANVSLFAQNPSISTELPQVVPPSPTVAGLMKFEEVPVNNYTGIPDISIPLYGVQSRSADIGINLSLNYHPGSIAAEEVSSFVGLGWSLFAGGTISRTVRGLPDDICSQEQGGQPARYGLHCNSSQYFMSNYYNIIGTANYTGYMIDMYNDVVKKFFWEALEKGWHDTEHDLYQYNFMGYSGRFIIEKSGSMYIVKKLDNDNSLKITYDHLLQEFSIIDDKGNIYKFDIKEETIFSTYSEVNYYLSGGLTPPLAPNTYNYISAFHLSSIKDFNGDLLETFYYNSANEVMREVKKNISTTNNTFLYPSMLGVIKLQIDNGCANPEGEYVKLPPRNIITFQVTDTQTKKLKRIEIPNRAKIYFDFEAANLGTDNNNSYRLKDVKIFDWFETQTPIKMFKFFYTMSTVDGRSRLMLTKVAESDGAEYKKQFYNLSYFETPSVNPLMIGRDHWGYFNNTPAYVFNPYYRETTPDFCRIDALKRMTLPTGGAIEFNFEANTYSYDGDKALENFDNEDNWIVLAPVTKHYEFCPAFNATGEEFITIDEEQDVTFTANVQLPGLFAGSSWEFIISQDPNFSTYISAINFTDCQLSTGCVITQHLEPGTYYVSFRVWNSEIAGYHFTNFPNITANYRERNPIASDNKFFYGGGVRIGNISYFENLNDTIPVRQKNYEYNFFNDKNRSSGSLTFSKPIFNYIRVLKNSLKIDDGCIFNGYEIPSSAEYRIYTSFNNLKVVRTQGADIGYRNVTVSEGGNGRSEYTYTSPIDNPEVDFASFEAGYTLSYPFFPSRNLDHRRGIMKNEKHYNEFSKLLSESTYDHTIVEDSIRSGIMIYNLTGCPFGGEYSVYSQYNNLVDNCDGLQFPDDIGSEYWCYHCGYVNEYIFYRDVLETFGWVKLTDKTTKEYFYKQDNTPYFVETKESFTYNPDNKKIASYEKEIYKSGNAVEKEKQEFTYISNATVRSENRISELERVKSFYNGEQIAQQEITFNNIFYPNVINVGKGTDTPEQRILISRYDAYKNPTEVKKKEGMTICYVRDYNTTQPLAMIQNATYTEVVNILATLGAPANPEGYTELDMADLNALRTALPNAMVTTYTYRPLVGVTSITDPRGLVTTYDYDSMGRLKEVRDHEGKLISENEYKYRTEE